jgi:hypothetical protein
MTISLTKEEYELILNWIYIEHEDGAYDEQCDTLEFQQLRKTCDGLEAKLKETKMKEDLKRLTNKINKWDVGIKH